MKTLDVFIILIILFCATSCSAQKYEQEKSGYKVYRNLKKALINKDDVRILTLSGRELKTFPSEILKLRNLKVLNLTDNQIEQIPSGIEQLKELERLEMMKNELKGLPSEITKLKNLKRINVAFNGLYDEDVEFIKQELPDCLIITQFTD